MIVREEFALSAVVAALALGFALGRISEPKPVEPPRLYPHAFSVDEIWVPKGHIGALIFCEPDSFIASFELRISYKNAVVNLNKMHCGFDNYDRER